MTPLLEQFLLESRDCLEQIGGRLLDLERHPGDLTLLNELFRLVHTLKGNSGLFDFHALTQVVHAGEDLLDRVRDQALPYSATLADRLLEAMDFVALLLDEIERAGTLPAGHGEAAARLSAALRQLLGQDAPESAAATLAPTPPAQPARTPGFVLHWLGSLPEAVRLAAARQVRQAGTELMALRYVPESDCFFKGEDPLFQMRQTPGLAALDIASRAPWPPLVELDVYQCNLVLEALSTAPREELENHFRYLREQVDWFALPDFTLMLPQGEASEDPVYRDFIEDARARLQSADWAGLRRATGALLEILNERLWIASALRWLNLELEHEAPRPPVLATLLAAVENHQDPDWQSLTKAAGEPVEPPVTPTPPPTQSCSDEDAFRRLWQAQAQVLTCPAEGRLEPSRLDSVAATLRNLLAFRGDSAALEELDAALASAHEQTSPKPLLAFLQREGIDLPPAPSPPATTAPAPANTAAETLPTPARADDPGGERAARVLKVSQEKVDRLMALIGEMVVAKNALPYLAKKAEDQYGSREMSRELKAQYAVINRIAEEMQDAIMQVRMLPVGSIFQRFPRLVRDLSRKLGKQVNLVIEGEDTEADKNLIESLADPLIHILRNSLDHGLETPEVRRAAGKSAEGSIRIQAFQESDRVIIHIQDDGKGIDPEVIKHKAYGKGLIDEARLDSLTDQEAVQLIFLPGFSTAEQISDLSGRGVGMDVVRSAVEKVHGSVSLTSQKGQGTQLRLSLPLSMAVSNVMTVESAGQLFGIPMEAVVETVRISQSRIQHFKQHQATVLRGRLVPLFSLNRLLRLDSDQRLNEDGEIALLVIRSQGEQVGIVVDDFQATIDVLLKPMEGVLAGIPGYAGTALLGDGTVLMILNLQELF